MQDEDQKRYQAVLLEEIHKQNKVILEGLDGLKELPAKVDKLVEDTAEVKSDIKVIKTVVKDHSTELKDHKQRITALENA